MADTKISALTAVATPVGTDQMMVNQGGTSKRLTLAQVREYLMTLGMPRVTRLNNTHTLSSTTGTEMTELRAVIPPGTFTVEAYLIVRSATGTVGPMIGVNFLGTAAVKTFIARWADATTALTAEVHSMDDEGNKGFGFISGLATKTYTTTAPNLGTTVGVAATAADILMRISGVLVVTAVGDLQWWHSSETNTSTSVQAGSSVVIIRTA